MVIEKAKKNNFTFPMASNFVAALAVSHNEVPKLTAQFSNLKEGSNAFTPSIIH